MEISIFSPLSSVKSPLQQLICAPRAAPAPRRSEGLRHSWPRHRAPGKKWVVCAYNMCVHIYIYIYIWLLIKIPLSRNGHSSQIKILLSQNFRELHVYLSRAHVGQQHLL